MITKRVKPDTHGLISSNKKESPWCVVCVKTKQSKTPVTGKLFDNSKMSPYMLTYVSCYKHPLFWNELFLILTAVPKQFVAVNAIRHLCEIEKHCFNFVKWIDRNCRYHVRRFPSDNGTELLALRKRFLRMENNSTTSSPYKSQFNGVAKIMNRTLFGETKVMIQSAGIDTRFLQEAIIEAAHVFKCTARPALNMKRLTRKCRNTSSKFRKYACSVAWLTRTDIRLLERTRSIGTMTLESS